MLDGHWLREARTYAATGLLMVLSGFALAQRSHVSLLALAILVCVALVVVGAHTGWEALIAWAALTGILFPFARYPRLHPYATFDRAIVPVMVAAIVLTPAPTIELRRGSRLLRGSATAFLIVYGVRAMSSGHHTTAAVRFVDAIVIPTVVLFAAERLVSSTHRLRRLCESVAIGGAMIAVVGIAERLIGFDLASRTGGTVRVDSVVGVRISGPFAVPEVYGLCLVVCLAATLCRAQMRPRGLAWIWSAFAALELAALALTYFRAVWVAAIAVLITAFGIRPRRLRRLVGAVAAVAAVLAVLSSQLQSDIAVQQRLHNTQNISARLATYAQALEIARHHPLFGVGVDGYADAASRLPEIALGDATSVPYPHSSYLGLLAEQGLVGLIPFVALTIGAFLTIRRLRNRAEEHEDVLFAAAMSGIGIGYLALSSTLTMLPYGSSNNLLALMLGAAAGRLGRIGGVATPSAG